MRKKYRKRQRKIIVLSMIGVFCFFSVSYAAFSSNFLIAGKGTIIEKPNAGMILKSRAVTSGDGLYADNVETGRYIYKGANPNNYVKFNNENYWRIYSIEEDNVIKIVRSSVIGESAFDQAAYRDLNSNGAGGTYCALGSRGCNFWMTYNNVVSGSISGSVLLDASLNTYLNTTYYDSLTTKAKETIKPYDFNIGYIYENANSLSNEINREKNYAWNGNVGLLGYTEYIRANTNSSQCGTQPLLKTNVDICKSTNWLYNIVNTSANKTMWLISFPASHAYRNFYVLANGSVDTNYSYTETLGAAPVVHLNANNTLDGSGTIDDPYVITISK